MNPNFAEANQKSTGELSSVAGAQDGITKVEPSAFVECPLDGRGTLTRAVDVYRGPKGDGYVVRFLYELDGELWCRCEATGPQMFRSHNWIKIPNFKNAAGNR